eukprot:GILK01008449.1.p1 GENE.GILK01008449.1~~GILK01008449.1.p1  ORF type:complete len:489 (-),score=106.96 GILK01008449.1:92-1462(-)
MSNLPWVEALRAFKQDHVVSSDEQKREQEVIQKLKGIFEEERKKETEQKPSLKIIPKFFVKKTTSEDIMQQKLRREARTRFLKRKTEELLEQEYLEQLWFLLKENVTSNEFDTETETERINYDHFCHVASLLPPKCRKFFTASTFLKFERDEHGRIEIVPFFHYVVRKVNLYETRIQLSFYDSAGYGYLREKDLENYIFELIPTLPQLHNLQSEFFPFYVFTAVRKFFFFLDPKKTGRIFIRDMLTSPILAELYELRQEAWTEEEALANWFSVQSALRVYGQYLNLDVDHNGMLSKKELARFGSGMLTEVFIDRVFQEYQTYEGEMDYKTFLDFVLAMDNKKTPQGLSYIFRLLDVQKKQLLDGFVVNYFFRAVVKKLEEMGNDPVNMEDVKDEIFDMVKPTNPLGIALTDLIACGVGDTVVSMLIDMNAFWAYDNREFILQQAEPDDGSNGGPGH